MIDFPLWFTVLLLGMVFWPVTLALFVVVVAGTFATRGAARAALATVAVLCLAELGWAAWAQLQAGAGERTAAAYEARIHQMLEQPMTVDGLELPAWTEVEWSDESRSHLHSASFDHPTPFFGVRFTSLLASDDGKGWAGLVEAPQEIEGWTCGEHGTVSLSAQGRLRLCYLARGRDWKRWPIPARSLLDLTSEDGLIGLTLPGGSSLPAPEIGHAVPPAGTFHVNADGSLHDVYFDDDDPLVVHGLTLWNTVSWDYAPGTLGQGRSRRAVTVTGTLSRTAPGQEGLEGTAIIRLSDGKVTPVE